MLIFIIPFNSRHIYGFLPTNPIAAAPPNDNRYRPCTPQALRFADTVQVRIGHCTCAWRPPYKRASAITHTRIGRPTQPYTLPQHYNTPQKQVAQDRMIIFFSNFANALYNVCNRHTRHNATDTYII